jgi:hypothetical protein
MSDAHALIIFLLICILLAVSKTAQRLLALGVALWAIWFAVAAIGANH